MTLYGVPVWDVGLLIAVNRLTWQHRVRAGNGGRKLASLQDITCQNGR
jgi:hypothetical protein